MNSFSLTDEEAHALGETPTPWPPDPAPLPSYNERRNLFDGWTRVKDIGEKSQNLKPSLKPYSIVVSASGFAFLQSTKIISKTNHMKTLNGIGRLY